MCMEAGDMFEQQHRLDLDICHSSHTVLALQAVKCYTCHHKHEDRQDAACKTCGPVL